MCIFNILKIIKYNILPSRKWRFINDIKIPKYNYYCYEENKRHTAGPRVVDRGIRLSVVVDSSEYLKNSPEPISKRTFDKLYHSVATRTRVTVNLYGAPMADYHGACAEVPSQASDYEKLTTDSTILYKSYSRQNKIDIVVIH